MRVAHFDVRTAAFRHPCGYLATGHETADWLVARGARADRVFPFAYFLSDGIGRGPAPSPPAGGFRILFAGQFIERKRLDLLIPAVAALGREDVELQVVGSGPQEEMLRRLAAEAVGSRLRWIGRVPSGDVPGRMAQADLLVLPSRHDGWGAVVSEAIMVGTPAVCSDRCGSAGVVQASGRGGVFPADDLGALTALLRRLVDEGPPSTDQRAALAQWGRRLGAATFADLIGRFLSKSNRSGTSGLFDAYEASRGFLIDRMVANIADDPLRGIGFGIASEPSLMVVERDPVLGLPLGAAIEKGIAPLAVLEELGVLGALLVAAWIIWLLRRGAVGGLAPFAVCLTALALNMGENTLFSPGGQGMLPLILFGWAYASGSRRAGSHV